MLRRIFATFLGSLILGSGFVLAAETYTVDSVHSSILFRSKRFDVVHVYGRFNDLTGTLVVDEENPEQSSIELEIKAETVDTNNERRDDHLRSPDFFNATQFPLIRFKSTRVRKLAENRYEVTGDLSLHGVTRSVVAEVEHVGSGKHPRRGTPMIGFETTFGFKRSDYGMNYMVGPLSDEVEIILALQGVAE